MKRRPVGEGLGYEISAYFGITDQEFPSGPTVGVTSGSLRTHVSPWRSWLVGLTRCRSIPYPLGVGDVVSRAGKTNRSSQAVWS
jgi:hypothetical protein